MRKMRWVFLALAVWGAIHPMYWFVAFFLENNWSLNALIDSWYVNAGATGLVWDLTISAIALTVWIIFETFQRRDFIGLLAIPATFCIGVSCGLPLFLFLRFRHAG